MTKRNNWILPMIVFAFIFIGLIVRNIKFASQPFSDWDEALYAQPAVEMLQNKTLVTTFNGRIWLDKPPLVHALVASTFLLFGQSEFWARLLMVLLAFALLLLLYFLARKVLNNFFNPHLSKLPPWQRELLYLLPILIVSSSSIFLEKAIFLNTDLIVAVSWLGYFLFVENYWLKLFFLLIGVFSKSVFGFYSLIYDLISIKKKYLTKQNLLKALLLVVLSFSWYAYSYLRFGNYFIRDHFLDQIFKRVVVPIELHFGNKFYYFEYLWRDLNWLNLLIIIGYVLLLIDFYKLFRRKGLKLREDTHWWSFVVLLAPLPFFVFLTVIKTKLYWYLMMIIPLIALVVPYLAMKINKAWAQLGLFLIVLGYFLYQFLPQTFWLQTNVIIADKITVARCLSQKRGKSLAFLPEPQERKNQNFLEASHYQTITSFLYGGSPAFVFYVQKRVDFYYKPDQFIINSARYPEVVISAQDLKSNSKLATVIDSRKISCRSGDWLSYEKN